MKLNIDEFETYAIEQGYESGTELFESLGFTAEDYEDYKDGKNITREMLMRLYTDIGAADVVGFVDFGRYEWEENIDLFDKL